MEKNDEEYNRIMYLKIVCYKYGGNYFVSILLMNRIELINLIDLIKMEYLLKYRLFKQYIFENKL